MADAFFHAFDRAYALGKQEKDAERTTPNNRLKARRKSDGKVIEVEPQRFMEQDGSMYAPSELDFLSEKETAVLVGWICRDNNSLNAQILIGDKPKRTGFGFWENESCDCITLPKDSFPSVTWQSEPKKVKLTIEEIEE